MKAYTMPNGNAIPIVSFRTVKRIQGNTDHGRHRLPAAVVQDGKVTLIGEPVTTSARRFLRRGIVWQQTLDILLVILYRLGVSPEILSHVYRVTDSRFANHPPGKFFS
jgi:hypothetical protein